MNGDAARFELLKQELDHLESGIRNFDGIAFQVKGWCVTATVAIAGVAVTTERTPILVVAFGAIAGFWLVDGLYKSMQRGLIVRHRTIEAALHSGTVADAINPDKLLIPSITSAFIVAGKGFRAHVALWWSELRRPLLYGMYLLLATLVLVLGAAMALFGR